MNKTLESLRPILMEIQGHQMYLNPEDRAVCDHLIREKIWEPLETRIVLEEVGEGDVVLDLGANIGYYTLLFARAVGEKGKVFAFEPEPTNFALLEKNVAVNAYRNIELVQKAVSDRCGRARLYLNEKNKGDHRIRYSGEDRHSIEIETVRLDDYLKEYVGPIDFIKTDIQGAEAGALEGMSSLLTRNRHLKLMTEFWPGGLKQFGIEPEEYSNLLIKHGFSLYNINEAEKISLVTSAQLLQKYGTDDQAYTTLFCTRGKWERTYRLYTRGEHFKKDIARLIPAGATFILVDNAVLGPGGVAGGYRAIPFLERNGQYWGLPPDDETAIGEFERLRQAGANYIVFAWPAFWWLEYYSELHCHLGTHFRRVVQNDRLIVFDLHTQTHEDELTKITSEQFSIL